MNPETIIGKHYRPGTELYHILITHSRQVRDKALRVLDKHPELQADRQFITEAAMLHDIGIYLCNAPRIHCFGTHHYLQHGYLGAELLRNEGFPRHALVCERHTGAGISLGQIKERNLPLPHRDMRPVSLEEKIICYADKFYSKTELGTEHSIDRIHTSLRHHGNENVLIFEEWNALFG
ncbi:MAG: HD domain-containing protein [Bacteroidales bacterium]|jgi:uncharacterized protein|nr:HD domain-containing protein [Bacteroidales bacterium]